MPQIAIGLLGWGVPVQREAPEIPGQQSLTPYKCAVWGFLVHKPQFRIYIGDSRTFLEE